MTTVSAEADAIAEGYQGLASGDWAAARTAFEAALSAADSPEALDGLGRALWWLRDAEGAVVNRERAYSGFRREGELGRAARIALWLTREYALVWRNDAAANGWLARAERLLADVAPGSERGWLELARSERARDPSDAVLLASTALEVGSRTGDADLELRALAQLGLAEVSIGAVDTGLARLDEAMAAATGGEPTTLETFADVSCTLMLACELAGDDERPNQESRAGGFRPEIRPRLAPRVLPNLLRRRVCRQRPGRRCRRGAARGVAGTDGRRAAARCVHPATRLAEIRVHQGRFAEAEQLLEEFADEPEAVGAAASLRLARGEPAQAEALIRGRLAELGWSNLLAVPLLTRLVEAQLGQSAIAEARETAAHLEQLASVRGRERVEAAAALARGRIGLASGDPAAAEILEEAVNRYAGLRQRLDTARARLELARALAGTKPEVAIDVGRRAYNELEALGAAWEADAAAAFLRSLGAKGRSGPRSNGGLTDRETDVLRLLGRGSRTPRSPTAFSSARRPWSTTSAGSSGSSTFARAPKPLPMQSATTSGPNRGFPPTTARRAGS
jgi:hypothetical protein